MSETLAATQLLSGLIDTRVVRFELPVGPSVAPKKVHAVVLAFDGILWLYTPGLGTCLLGESRHAANAGPDEITAGLRRIDPTLRDINVYPNPVLPPPELETRLRNGCVAACFINLAALLVQDGTVTEAGIVFFSGRDPDHASTAPSTLLTAVGHSVLLYRTGGQWRGIDPAEPAAPFAIGRVETDAATDVALLADAQRHSYPIEHVRFLPISSGAFARLARDARWKAAEQFSSFQR